MSASSILRASFLGAVIPLFFGCSSSANIWLVEVNTSKGAGFDCTEKVSTNFSGTLDEAQVDTTGDITETSTSTTSNILFYVKIVDLGDGTATLNTGDLLLPGKETQKDKWVFSWSLTDTETQTTSHSAGYTFSSTYDEADTTTLTLQFDGKEAKGTMVVGSKSQLVWTESDIWTEDAANEIGRNGSLAWPTPDGTQSNVFDTAECDATDCRVSQTSECGASAPATAVRTDMGKSEDFESLAGLQQYGSFKVTESNTYGGGQDSGF